MPTAIDACGSSFDDLSDHVWSMLNDLNGKEYFSSHAPRSWRPRVNLYETPDRYIVCVELAGTTGERIDVQAYDDVLRIRGDRARPTVPDEPERVSVHLMEIDSGSFSRKIPLPSDADHSRLSAVYRQGYLWIFLPRNADRRDTSQT